MTPKPLHLCVESVSILMDSGDNPEVYQIAHCPKCSHQQTMPQMNQFFTWMRCQRCDAVTAIVECGYMVIMGGSRGTH